ncbi:MAG: sulfur oxidation c-type cytochrome SoxX [Rhodospirillales bacterium]|nr:sulfur oxidation c-type cytochrome SoxX [Rhodospirillales bacterium]
MLLRSALALPAALASVLAVPADAPAQGARPVAVVDGNAIPTPLTDSPGDAGRGRAIAVDRARGNCLACHALPVPEPLQGNVGPDLRGVAARLSEGELRLRVVDPKIVNAETAMPAYFRVDGLFRVRQDMVGRPILTAQEIEDVVAYLRTLQ